MVRLIWHRSDEETKSLIISWFDAIAIFVSCFYGRIEVSSDMLELSVRRPGIYCCIVFRYVVSWRGCFRRRKQQASTRPVIFRIQCRQNKLWTSKLFIATPQSRKVKATSWMAINWLEYFDVCYNFAKLVPDNVGAKSSWCLFRKTVKLRRLMRSTAESTTQDNNG